MPSDAILLEPENIVGDERRRKKPPVRDILSDMTADALVAHAVAVEITGTVVPMRLSALDPTLSVHRATLDQARRIAAILRGRPDFEHRDDKTLGVLVGVLGTDAGEHPCLLSVEKDGTYAFEAEISAKERLALMNDAAIVARRVAERRIEDPVIDISAIKIASKLGVRGKSGVSAKKQRSVLEAVAYLFLWDASPAREISIFKRLGGSRSSVYKALRALKDQGVVVERNGGWVPKV
jgi:hypothetical protein